MDNADLLFAGLRGQAELVQSGAVSSRELVSACLSRIEERQPLLNAFRVVMADEALAAADAADAAGPSAGRPLHGVPVAIKDDTDVAGQSTRYGSAATDDRPAEADAEVVRRLREAGAIIIGKTNVPELTQWPFTESDAFGVTRNPWNPAHTTGGSSGGTGAAVADGMVAAGLGSDGGGSIRIPAACCGLFGIKPQRNRLPLAPKPDAWHGLSVLGPLTRSVRDAALFMDVTADRPPGLPDGYLAAAEREPGRLRVAWSARPPLPGPVAPDQRHALADTVSLLGRLGHEVREQNPSYGAAIPAFLPRYLRGIADDARATAHPERLEARTKGMARAGGLVGDGLLGRAMRAEAGVAAKLNAIFDSHDVLMTPILAAQQLPIGRYAGRGALWTFNGVARFVPFAAPWNLTGQPAISVPAGFDADGLPLAVQIVGPPDSEALLISLAAQIEEARPWGDRRPG